MELKKNLRDHLVLVGFYDSSTATASDKINIFRSYVSVSLGLETP